MMTLTSAARIPPGAGARAGRGGGASEGGARDVARDVDVALRCVGRGGIKVRLICSAARSIYGATKDEAHSFVARYGATTRIRLTFVARGERLSAGSSQRDGRRFGAESCPAHPAAPQSERIGQTVASGAILSLVYGDLP
jgi:hypothetical protein